MPKKKRKRPGGPIPLAVLTAYHAHKGCGQCDAEKELVHSGGNVWTLRVRHDADCPELEMIRLAGQRGAA